MKTVNVKCTFIIPVELPDDIDAKFYVEESHCPGTGAVGTALGELIARGFIEGFCWACYLGGECEIVE